MSLISKCCRAALCIPLITFLAALAVAQQPGGTIRGQVTDSSGSSIPGANVFLTGAGSFAKTLSTDEQGAFSASGLPPGTYSVRVVANGFGQFENRKVAVNGGRATSLTIPLILQVSKQEVTVQAEAVGTVSVDAAANAGQLVLKGTDLDALPDDPDDLASDLQALAGPSAGPNGGQIYIDGFTGGRLPPKSSIREIRINQNPFSAEYDRLGFGRIEILTKPGSDKVRGQVMFNDSDAFFNSRNPFATNKPSFQSRQYEGNIGGPMGKKASFFVDFERREVDDNAIINATTLDANLNPIQIQQAVVTPNRRNEFSPRIDYQLNSNNTLVARYSYEGNTLRDAGVGTFNLLSRAYNTTNDGHRVQLTETAVLGAKVVNETRFQYLHDRNGQVGNNAIAAILVQDAFSTGSSQVGNAFNLQKHYEIQNYTSVAQGAHSIKFGARARTVTLDTSSPQNFGGTFVFAGGRGPQLDSNNQIALDSSGQPVLQDISSLEQYRRTLLFQNQGLTASEIRQRGGGASQFSIAGGNPVALLNQTDVGVFFLDDWRLKQNLTLSFGLRYETQTNIHDWRDIAPRFGFAWSPDGKKGRQGKTVVRGGTGLFYDRFSESLGLDAVRFNGINQQQFIIVNPAFFPIVPNIAALNAQQRPQTKHQVDRALRAPETLQSAIGVERQLPKNTTMAVTFTNSHTTHLFRSRNINAPLPGTISASTPLGVRPFGGGNIYNYESDGLLNQNQLITNLNSRFSKNLTIFAFYVFNHAKSNTDGAGTFPANQYNLSDEYGRSALDVRHRFVLGGSMGAKWLHGVRFNPFVIARSGSPFNITTGNDLNGDAVFTDRPSFATDCSALYSLCTPFGNFNTRPQAGAALIPRNYGNGPSSFTVNLRASKTWGFGESASNRPAGGSDGGGGGPRGGSRGGGPGGMMMGGGMRGMDGGGGTDKRYNLTLSISARNLLNTVNPGQYIGTLSSPLFGKANSLGGGFGPGGSSGNNRRIDFQLRFAF